MQSRWQNFHPRPAAASLPGRGGLGTAPPGGVDVQQSGAAAVHPAPAASESGVEKPEGAGAGRGGRGVGG